MLREALCSAEPALATRHGQVSLDWDFDRLGCDSVTLLDVIAALEDRLGVDLSDESLLEARTVGDLVRLLRRSGGGEP